jgi:hypothetical protein
MARARRLRPTRSTSRGPIGGRGIWRRRRPSQRSGSSSDGFAAGCGHRPRRNFPGFQNEPQPPLSSLRSGGRSGRTSPPDFLTAGRSDVERKRGCDAYARERTHKRCAGSASKGRMREQVDRLRAPARPRRSHRVYPTDGIGEHDLVSRQICQVDRRPVRWRAAAPSVGQPGGSSSSSTSSARSYPGTSLLQAPSPAITRNA